MSKFKKLLASFLAVVMVLTPFSLLGAFAETLTSADGKYEYVLLEDSTARLTYYNNQTPLETAITVPSTIDGYTVTQLGENLYSGRSYITDFTLPEGIKAIERNVFYDTAFWENKQKWTSDGLLYIGDYFISACYDVEESEGYQYPYLRLKETTKLIAAHAINFYGTNSSVSYLYIPASVMGIGSQSGWVDHVIFGGDDTAWGNLNVEI